MGGPDTPPGWSDALPEVPTPRGDGGQSCVRYSTGSARQAKRWP